MGNKAALRQGDWKIVRQPGGTSAEGWELYHLGQDLGEEHNLAAKQPQRLNDLVSRWQKLNRQMVPPAWTRGK